MSLALRALIVTVAIELPVVALCFPDQRLRLAFVALIVNCLTNPLLNLVLPAIPLFSGEHVVIGEVLAVVMEAVAYGLAARGRECGRALAVSAACNALSYEFGGALASTLWD